MIEYYLKADKNDLESSSEEDEDSSFKVNEERVTAIKFYEKENQTYTVHNFAPSLISR